MAIKIWNIIRFVHIIFLSYSSTRPVIRSGRSVLRWAVKVSIYLVFTSFWIEAKSLPPFFGPVSSIQKTPILCQQLWLFRAIMRAIESFDIIVLRWAESLRASACRLVSKIRSWLRSGQTQPGRWISWWTFCKAVASFGLSTSSSPRKSRIPYRHRDWSASWRKSFGRRGNRTTSAATMVPNTSRSSSRTSARETKSKSCIRSRDAWLGTVVSTIQRIVSKGRFGCLHFQDLGRREENYRKVDGLLQQQKTPWFPKQPCPHGISVGKDGVILYI